MSDSQNQDLKDPSLSENAEEKEKEKEKDIVNKEHSHDETQSEGGECVTEEVVAEEQCCSDAEAEENLRSLKKKSGLLTEKEKNIKEVEEDVQVNGKGKCDNESEEEDNVPPALPPRPPPRPRQHCTCNCNGYEEPNFNDSPDSSEYSYNSVIGS